MSAGNQAQLRAVVHGRVQGVSFRYYTVQEALRLGITGWVQNRPDGAVEVCAEGSRRQLEDFWAFLRRGSPAASVRQVDIQWQPASGAFTSFTIRYAGKD